MISKTGLIYSFKTTKTGQAAKMILDEFGESDIELVNAEEITKEKFSFFSTMILGVPTWFDGELPNYWDEFIPDLEEVDLKGKKIALFGNGDQKEYPENFIDGLGIMAELLESLGAKIVGKTSVVGYEYEFSRAQRENKFLGLALDFENQARKNKERIKNWVLQLKREFGNE